jgi:Cys-tRNA(Pro) deacylase
MPRTDSPVTSAVRFLRGRRIPFEPYLYQYEEHGGTAYAAGALHVPEHNVVKTLVMETDTRKPLLVLMHGDREVSTKELARTLGVKRVTPCEVAVAQKHTGYTVGGISPFGTRTALPVCVERTILSLPRIYINGGRRGFLVGIDPGDLHRAISFLEVSVAIAARSDEE